MEERGWAQDRRLRGTPSLWGVSQTKGEERQRDPRELLLEPWLSASVMRHLWGGHREGGQQERARVVLGERWDSGLQVQEARSQAAGFWNLGEQSAACTHLRWRLSGKHWVTSGWKASPSTESHPQLPGLSEALASPSPSWQLRRGHVHSRFPSQQLGLTLKPQAKRAKLGVVAEGARQQSTPAQPGRANGTLEGWMLLRWHVYDPASPYSYFLASPCWFWLGGSQFCCWIWEPWGWGWTELLCDSTTQDGSSPFPHPLDFIFSTPTTLLQNVSISELERALSIIDPVPPFLDGETEAQRRKGTCPKSPKQVGTEDSDIQPCSSWLWNPPSKHQHLGCCFVWDRTVQLSSLPQ